MLWGHSLIVYPDKAGQPGGWCGQPLNRDLKGIFQCKFNPWSNTPWHRVRRPLKRSRFLTASLCSFSNLRKKHMITIHCSLWLQQETTIKKPQIMLRTAPNFSKSTNRVPAHSSRHQTVKLLALPDFYWKQNTAHHSPAASCSLWGSPDRSITECGVVLQLKDENIWLLLHGNAINFICILWSLKQLLLRADREKNRTEHF